MRVPNFERLFRVPHDHRLVLLRSRERGGATRSVRWTHELVHRSGAVAARYESFCDVDGAGRARSGWRRYDEAGRLSDEQVFPGDWSSH